ncbi:MAG: hypothetical protein P1U36_08850 [Legionellaceae bacterium]|nr:hypothetical protein [Legionellaceae bacterium]
MIRLLISIAFMSANIATYAATAGITELPVSTGNHPQEIMLSTMNIPERAAVTVHCAVTLPHYYKSKFNFYVVPQVGDFGAIRGKYDIGHMSAIPQETSEWQVIGSKIYTTNSSSNNSSFFTITHVHQNNEAIIMDLSTMPGDTTVSCSY